jgi:hypothetical protein
MRRRPVSSSALRSVGYDPQERLLEVEFESGEVYQYQGVELMVHKLLMRADSMGRFVNERIKPNYPSVHVDQA